MSWRRFLSDDGGRTWVAVLCFALVAAGVGIWLAFAVAPDSEADERIETAAEPAQPQENDGLAGWWRFDEGGGIFAADSSGQGRTATLFGQPPPAWQPDGVSGGTLEFGGKGWVELRGQRELVDGTEQLTVGLWVKQSAKQDGVLLWAGTEAEEARLVVALAEHGHVVFALAAGGRQWSVMSKTALPADGLWHQVAGVYDGSGLQVVVDGNPERRLPVSGVIEPGAAVLRLGEAFVGAVEEVRIYRRALADGEIAEWMEGDARRLETGTVGSVEAEPEAK